MIALVATLAIVARLSTNAMPAPDYVGELFVLGGIVLAAMLGWVGTILIKRIREPTRIETLWERIDGMTKTIYGDPEDAAKPGLLFRMEKSERRDAAKSRIIRDLAGQWPYDRVPRLNPNDIAELEEDTLPEHWRVKP